MNVTWAVYNHDQKERTLPGVIPGTFIVRQGNIQGWTLMAIGCTVGQIYNIGQRRLKINLQDSQDLTCTFTNALRKPDAMISKEIDGPYKGNDLYFGAPDPAQTQTRAGVARAHTYSFFVEI